MAPASVFLSFSSRDAALAAALRDGLQARGLEVWKAPESIPPGVDWATAIHAGIQQQQLFLLLWSDAAMASAEVSKEVSLASQYRRLLLPLRLTAAMPQGGQAYHLGNIQWLEGQGVPLPALLDRLEARIHELVEQGPQVALATMPVQSNRGSNLRRPVLQVLLALIGASALACDLAPWNPPSQWLLNQRLFWQARWRQLTAQSGPTPPPIGLLSLSLAVYEQLGVQPTNGSVNQAVLAQALQALAAKGAPQRVGLDFILDGPGANPQGHGTLAETIRSQQGRRLILAGLCPPNSLASPDCLKAGDQRLAAPLAAAGAKAASLGLGTSTEGQPPLQLMEAVGSGSLAEAMSTAAPRGGLPPDAVIDWSVNWLSPERLTLISSRQELAAFRGETLLIASDGFKGERLSEVADQHPAPQAVWAFEGQGPERFASTLQAGALPGGAVQVAMAQAISSGHWLQPLMPLMPTTATSALLAIAAWWTARRELDRRKLAVGLGLAAMLYILLGLQLAVSLRRLVPFALPLSAAAAIVGLRRSKRIRS
ncbi:MAG: TIR domain-containing protein [Cyanobacteriota bacterium]|nr:TIR domain-containing protein [Cyanobacteriota bacterium]